VCPCACGVRSRTTVHWPLRELTASHARLGADSTAQRLVGVPLTSPTRGPPPCASSPSQPCFALDSGLLCSSLLCSRSALHCTGGYFISRTFVTLTAMGSKQSLPAARDAIAEAAQRDAAHLRLVHPNAVNMRADLVDFNVSACMPRALQVRGALMDQARLRRRPGRSRTSTTVHVLIVSTSSPLFVLFLVARVPCSKSVRRRPRVPCASATRCLVV
jgi:hypothetical protein